MSLLTSAATKFKVRGRCGSGTVRDRGSWEASTTSQSRIGTMNWIVLVVVLVLEKRVGQSRTRTKGRFMGRIPRNFRALNPEPGRDSALRRPRRAQRRNDAARCFAGGDIAARCPYQSQVHGELHPDCTTAPFPFACLSSVPAGYCVS